MRKRHLSSGTGRFLVLSVPVILLILGCVGPPTQHPFAEPAWIPEAERETVDLSGLLKSLDGEDYSLAEIKTEGEVLFLNLWATWCLPCQEEMPAMATLYDQLSERGLAMVAVSDEDPQTVGRFMEEFRYPFTVLLDPENILGERFGVLTIPTTLVVDGQGQLALRHSGAFPWDAPQVIEQFLDMLPER